MLTLPKIFDRAQQPYVAIGATVPMGAIEDIAPKLFNEIWSWVDKRNLAPAGGAILKYNVIDMAGDLELEFGVPLLNAGESDGRVISGMLPAGRYAAVTWHGGYDALYDVNAVLIGWAKERGIRWDVEEASTGDKFGCRMEIYKSDPATVPNPADWETEVTIRLADA